MKPRSFFFYSQKFGSLKLTQASQANSLPCSKSLRRAVESHLEARLVALQREARLEAGAAQCSFDSWECINDDKCILHTDTHTHVYNYIYTYIYTYIYMYLWLLHIYIHIDSVCIINCHHISIVLAIYLDPSSKGIRQALQWTSKMCRWQWGQWGQWVMSSPRQAMPQVRLSKQWVNSCKWVAWTARTTTVPQCKTIPQHAATLKKRTPRTPQSHCLQESDAVH